MRQGVTPDPVPSADEIGELAGRHRFPYLVLAGARGDDVSDVDFRIVKISRGILFETDELRNDKKYGARAERFENGSCHLVVALAAIVKREENRGFRSAPGARSGFERASEQFGGDECEMPGDPLELLAELVGVRPQGFVHLHYDDSGAADTEPLHCERELIEAQAGHALENESAKKVPQFRGFSAPRFLANPQGNSDSIAVEYRQTIVNHTVAGRGTRNLSGISIK